MSRLIMMSETSKRRKICVLSFLVKCCTKANLVRFLLVPHFFPVSPIYSYLPQPHGILYTTFDLLSPSGCRAFVFRPFTCSPGRVTILNIYFDATRLNCCERPSRYGTTYVPFVLSVVSLGFASSFFV